MKFFIIINALTIIIGVISVGVTAGIYHDKARRIELQCNEKLNDMMSAISYTPHKDKLQSEIQKEVHDVLGQYTTAKIKEMDNTEEVYDYEAINKIFSK